MNKHSNTIIGRNPRNFLVDLNSCELQLCRLLRGEIVSKNQIKDRNLFDTAVANEISSIIAHTFATQFSWENVPKNWQDEHDKIQESIAMYLTELDSVAKRFAAKKIPLVILKNGGIARGIYRCLGCSPMGDLDVLVERKHFQAAHQIMLDEGFHFKFRSELEKEDLGEAERDGSTEYWKMLPNGEKLWFELQWRPVSGRWVSPAQEPSAEDLIARAIPILDTDARLLSPEDNLLQVCIHTAKHSYVRAPGFRLHLDVKRIVHAYPNLDWQLFVKRVIELEVKTAVYFSLLIPCQLFGTPVPAWVFEHLSPVSWKRNLLTQWIKRAGIFNPHEKKFGRIEYIFFTILLYDNLNGLWRSIFPNRNWMKRRYEFQNLLWLPYYHTLRLVNLIFKRVAT